MSLSTDIVMSSRHAFWKWSHSLCIIVHVGLMGSGAASFVASGIDLGHDNYDVTVISWGSGAWGMVGLSLSVFVFCALLLTDKLDANITEEEQYLRKMHATVVALLSNLMLAVCDAALACTIRDRLRIAPMLVFPCVFAAVGALLAIVVSIADVTKLRRDRIRVGIWLDGEEQHLMVDEESDIGY